MIQEIKAVNVEISKMRKSYRKIWRNSGLYRRDKYKGPDMGINMHISEKEKTSMTFYLLNLRLGKG